MRLVEGTGIFITFGVLISHISVETWILHHHGYSTYLFAIASSETRGKWVQVLGSVSSGIVWADKLYVVMIGRWYSREPLNNQSYLKLVNPNEPSNRCAESLYPFYLTFLEWETVP